MEERIGKRISEERVDDVIKTGAEIVATACPYCLQMFEDAIKAKELEESLKVMDLAEMVEDCLATGPSGSFFAKEGWLGGGDIML